MDHPVVVGVMDGRRHVAHRLERPAQLQLHPAQRPPLHVLHHDEAAAVLLGDAVDRDDVRVRQARGRQRLAREALGGLLRVGRGHRELQRDPAAQAGVPGLPHLADAALTQARDTDEFRHPALGLAQHRRDLGGHGAVGTEERVVLAVQVVLEFLHAFRGDAFGAEELFDADRPGKVLLGEKPGANGEASEVPVLRAAEDAAQAAHQVERSLLAFRHYAPPNSASHSCERSSGLPTDSQRIERTALRNSSRLRVR